MTRRAFGSVVRLGSSHYRVSVSHGRDGNGKRRRTSRVVRGSRQAAEKVLARLLLDVDQAPVRSASMTLSEYLDGMWLPHISEKVRQLTSEGYEHKLDNQVRPYLGDVRLDRLDPYRIDKWLAQVKGSQQTRLNAFRVLNGALAQAVKWRVIERNPLNAVPAPKVDRKAPDVLSQEEANAYLDAFEGHALEPVVLLAIGCGLRRSELAALTWADLDFTAGTLSVTKGLHQSKGKVWVEKPKTTRSSRVVALPPWCLARLRVLRAVGPLVSSGGAPMSPDTITSRYKALVQSDENTLRYVPLKNLRHTSATLALALGVDLVSVSRRLGHSTVTTTDTYYVAPGRKADEIAAEKMDGIRSVSKKKRKKA